MRGGRGQLEAPPPPTLPPALAGPHQCLQGPSELNNADRTPQEVLGRGRMGCGVCGDLGGFGLARLRFKGLFQSSRLPLHINPSFSVPWTFPVLRLFLVAFSVAEMTELRWGPGFSVLKHHHRVGPSSPPHPISQQVGKAREATHFMGEQTETPVPWLC